MEVKKRTDEFKSRATTKWETAPREYLTALFHINFSLQTQKNQCSVHVGFVCGWGLFPLLKFYAVLDFNARSLGLYSSFRDFKPKHELSSWVTSLGFPDNSVIFWAPFYPLLWMHTDTWFYCILMLLKYSQWNLCRAVGFKLVCI